MKRRMAGVIAAVGSVIAAYAVAMYHDRGYFTREAVVMLGILIVAGFATVLGFGFLFARPRRPPKKRAEIVVIPRRDQ